MKGMYRCNSFLQTARLSLSKIAADRPGRPPTLPQMWGCWSTDASAVCLKRSREVASYEPTPLNDQNDLSLERTVVGCRCGRCSECHEEATDLLGLPRSLGLTARAAQRPLEGALLAFAPAHSGYGSVQPSARAAAPARCPRTRREDARRSIQRRDVTSHRPQPSHRSGPSLAICGLKGANNGERRHLELMPAYRLNAHSRATFQNQRRPWQLRSAALSLASPRLHLTALRRSVSSCDKQDAEQGYGRAP